MLQAPAAFARAKFFEATSFFPSFFVWASNHQGKPAPHCSQASSVGLTQKQNRFFWSQQDEKKVAFSSCSVLHQNNNSWLVGLERKKKYSVRLWATACYGLAQGPSFWCLSIIHSDIHRNKYKQAFMSSFCFVLDYSAIVWPNTVCWGNFNAAFWSTLLFYLCLNYSTAASKKATTTRQF